MLETKNVVQPIGYKALKEALINLQHAIIDQRFVNVDYRTTQNYVGQNATSQYQVLHYISPKPEDVAVLMDGLLQCLERMLEAQVCPAIIAAAISFGFVFIHPFDDGNGRIHRFLIHYILRATGFVSSDGIIPVSATMLNDRVSYDKVLESFSKPLLGVLKQYAVDATGTLTVEQESICYYEYIDYTTVAEFLFGCIEATVTKELPHELNFLDAYDKIKEAMQHVVDMPDKKIDLFITLALQNDGNLSPAKRKHHFTILTDQEIKRMEMIIKKFMPILPLPGP